MKLKQRVMRGEKCRAKKGPMKYKNRIKYFVLMFSCYIFNIEFGTSSILSINKRAEVLSNEIEILWRGRASSSGYILELRHFCSTDKCSNFKGILRKILMNLIWESFEHFTIGILDKLSWKKEKNEEEMNKFTLE